MQVEADPNQLRYTASPFSNGAKGLWQKAKRLEVIQNGLVFKVKTVEKAKAHKDFPPQRRRYKTKSGKKRESSKKPLKYSFGSLTKWTM